MLPIHFFERAARGFSDSEALVDATGSMTYRELAIHVELLASNLQVIDPRPLSRVAICAFNSREHLIAWLAVLAAGKTWVPLYPKSPREELIRRIKFTDATILITSEPWMDLANETGARLVLLEGDGENSLGKLCKADGHRLDLVNVDLGETQAIKFTGGSTGIPKGVLQTFRGWNTNIISQIDAWGMRPGDRFLACSPITHGTSTYLLPTLATGGTVVIADQPKPHQILELFERYGVTATFVAPTTIYMMLEQKSLKAKSFPQLRNLIYGGGPMREAAIVAAQKAFGPVVASTYGQTEASQIATFITGLELADGRHTGSVGREAPLTHVAIMSDDGTLQAPGDDGEIVVKGDLVMSGYLKQPEVTARTVENGWLHTGDIGTMDGNGYLYIHGRLKEMIISGGFNVYPKDVEQALANYKDVTDCVVFGVPDKKWGEAVHAAVCLRPGTVLDECALLSHVKSIVGSIATPKSVHLYDALPRNPYGKLERNQLVADCMKSLRKNG